uniref:Reverse transcriptase domain-containing protein n=1 Tax=Cannabis sativa TaxID=3483 RepID=A0A803PZR9_CANSA
MKILTWNIRGSGDKVKRRAIKATICKINLDLVILQEVKKTTIDRSFIGNIWRSRFKAWIYHPAWGRSGGTLLVWDTRSVTVLDSLVGEFSISTLIQAEGKNPWWFFGIYGPCSYKLRPDFWDELAGLKEICGASWCLGGDFNVVRRVGEKLNSVSNTRNHSPVVIDSNPPKWGHSPFRFDNQWLENKSFSKLFEIWWNKANVSGWPGTRFMTKLRIVQENIKKWSKTTFGNSKIAKAAMERRILEIDKLEGTSMWNQSLADERRGIKKDWQQKVFEEERNIWLKSKCKWVKEGDANSRFFHNLLNARKAKNTISRIEREDGTILDREDDIVSELISFFSKLYTSERKQGADIEGIEWQKISESSARLLENPFDEDEIKRALFSCDGNKAPGPDGFSMAALQTNWDVIKGELIDIFKAFEVEGRIQGSMNETFICLIPKKLNSCKVKDFRPISLITSVYKIIAKALATRLKYILGDTISDTQSAFVEGRQILDSVMIANETVEDYRSRGKSGMVFKIDFEKAYDRVEWDFLDLVMHKKGFGSTWRKWIRGCLSTTSFSIFVNGRPRGKFRASRGLRQGDPLSPFLFTLVADILGRMVDKAVNSGSLSGFRVGKDKIQISHLQFVKGFCALSGLKVNLSKSQLLGLCMDELVVSQCAAQIGCEVGCWPMKYLGMPLAGSPRKKIFWDPVLEKCAKRLDGWKCAFLSRGGRYTLIQSVLSSLPIYFLPLFKALSSMINTLEKLMRDFLWEGGDLGGGDHLMAWDWVCKPRLEG